MPDKRPESAPGEKMFAADLAAVTDLQPEEIERKLASGGITLTSEQSAALEARFAERRWAAFYETAERGDYLKALSWLSSTEVAAAIVRLFDEYVVTADEAREILRVEWDRCDAPAESVADLLPIWRRAGYVSDTEERLTGELTVYRGTAGDDPLAGISWTLDEERAEWFAEHGARGRARGEPTVWQAKVDASDLLGYFVGRNEAEVVVDPATLRDVEEA
jgi:hypothetical protein